MASENASAEQDGEAEITLGVLSAIEEDSAATQRSISRDLGIALGLTNAYLKRCVRKGFIKMTHAPANRYAYYLTPKGFAEKSRLTREYLTISFNFFRAARSQCSAVFAECAKHGWRRVLLAGVSDLSEIATLCAAENGLELIGILDETSQQKRHAGLPVYARLADTGAFDVVVVTDFGAPQERFDRLVEAVPRERVLAPEMLKVSREPPTLAE